MLKLILLTLLYHTISFASAATIMPITLERQLQDSTGVIYGKFIKQKSVFRFDKVFTEATFKVHKSAGLQYRDILTKGSFNVIYPGGSWQGIRYTVSGTPRFNVGENIVLLVTKTDIGFVPTNSALGKYNLLRKGKDEYLVSSYFPKHPELGSIPISSFEESVYSIIGEKLVEHGLDKTRSIKAKMAIEDKQLRKRGGRKIASFNQDMEESKSKENSVFWPVVLFALLGAYSVIITWKKN